LNDLCSYEPALDVGVNHSGRSVSIRTALDRPRAAFVFAGRQEADQVQQRVSGANESVARRFGDAEVLKKLALLFRVKLGDFHLDLTGHRDEIKLLRARQLTQLVGDSARGGLFRLVDQQQQRLQA